MRRVAKLSGLAVLLVCMTTLRADPWGKDADLAGYRQGKCANESRVCSTPLLGAAAEALINFHQEIISPADGPRSHFLPSSSQYTLEAMRKHGFYSGFLMGCDRLMRENAEVWVYKTAILPNGKSIKLDPVP